MTFEPIHPRIADIADRELTGYKLASVIIKPTTKEVRGGMPRSCRLCPYALAVKRQIARAEVAEVGPAAIMAHFFQADIREALLSWRLPTPVSDWIKKYDSCGYAGSQTHAQPPEIAILVPAHLLTKRREVSDILNHPAGTETLCS